MDTHALNRDAYAQHGDAAGGRIGGISLLILSQLFFSFSVPFAHAAHAAQATQAAQAAQVQNSPTVDLSDPNVSVDLSVLNDGGIAPHIGAPVPTTATTTPYDGLYRPPGKKPPVSMLYVKPSANFKLPPQTKPLIAPRPTPQVSEPRPQASKNQPTGLTPKPAAVQIAAEPAPQETKTPVLTKKQISAAAEPTEHTPVSNAAPQEPLLPPLPASASTVLVQKPAEGKTATSEAIPAPPPAPVIAVQPQDVQPQGTSTPSSHSAKTPRAEVATASPSAVPAPPEVMPPPAPPPLRRTLPPQKSTKRPRHPR